MQTTDLVIRKRWGVARASNVFRLLKGLCLSIPALLGMIIAVVMVMGAVFAPLIAPYAPDAIHYQALLSAPNATHWLGTDDLGRDIFSRLLFGARLSLSVGCSAVLLAVVVGVPVGLISGYLGGIADEFMMRVLDSVIALPPLVLALTISAVLGPGLFNATIAIAIVAVPTYARLIRGQVLSVKNNDYVLAARSVGVPAIAILFRHLLPNVMSPIIVQASLGVGFAIILESSLSFIGLGAQPPTATWGSMVQIGFQYLELAPWFVLAPSIAIFLTVLSANLLAEGLRDQVRAQETKGQD
ncbi:ABC transporter permease [Limibacillus halophilus]|uniref:ABC-type dipeptide/oligopeptide/nickel transport system permease subunit n=1 Tax=Limibacillus halophilus TaxID=1579333 RepID=A0A839SUB6_9PROT|nr:ABC transporter permease [Limibacillus halophilus]MBB3064523.1 ABC-type dipeptide/oligopeptide/nickel transport system permease subunit [Limibacillus halophilus]